jgi:hypothetical protein
VIDHPESCCSEQRGEGYTDHFRTFMAAGIDAAAPLPPAVPQPRQPGDEHIKTEKHQTDCSGFIVVASTQSFLDRDYSLLNRSLCKFGILSKDCNNLLNVALSATRQDGPAKSANSRLDKRSRQPRRPYLLHGS